MYVADDFKILPCPALFESISVGTVPDMPAVVIPNNFIPGFILREQIVQMPRHNITFKNLSAVLVGQTCVPPDGFGNDALNIKLIISVKHIMLIQ